MSKRLMIGPIVWTACQSIPKSEFTVEDLAVACHRHDPKTFGMKGYSQYPDLHKIWYLLSGDNGFVARGLVVRISTGTYKMGRLPGIEPVTPTNNDINYANHDAAPESVPNNNAIRAADTTWMGNRLGSAAVRRYANNEVISALDAVMFFHLRKRSDLHKKEPLVVGFWERLRQIEERRNYQQRDINLVRNAATRIEELYMVMPSERTRVKK